MTLHIDKNNLDALTIECRDTYFYHHYYYVLALYADKRHIKEAKIESWFNVSDELYIKLTSMELTLGYLGIKQLVSEIEKETLRMEATIKALKDLGLR